MQTHDHTALLALLEVERTAILTGDFDTIGTLAPTKRAALENLAIKRAPRRALDEIATGLMQNQRLMRAAIDGVRDARVRLSALVAARTSLQTYDSNGRGSCIAQAKSAIEKKA